MIKIECVINYLQLFFYLCLFKSYCYVDVELDCKKILQKVK